MTILHLSTTADSFSMLLKIITVVDFYIATRQLFCIYWPCNSWSITITIVIVPTKVFASHVHAFDFLAQMGVRLQKYEGGVSWKKNGVGGVSVSAAAVLDNCVSLVIDTVWYLTAEGVLVIILFINPSNSCILETCVAQNMSIIRLFIEEKQRNFKLLNRISRNERCREQTLGQLISHTLVLEEEKKTVLN